MDFYFSSPVCSAPTEWFSANWGDHEPKHGWYFVYGALADPNTLLAVLGLAEDDKLDLRPATTSGFKTVRRGQDIVLVRQASGGNAAANDDAAVSGVAFEIKQAVHATRLQDYLSNRFRVGKCCIRFAAGQREELIDGFTFEWIGETGQLLDI